MRKDFKNSKKWRLEHWSWICDSYIQCEQPKHRKAGQVGRLESEQYYILFSV